MTKLRLPPQNNILVSIWLKYTKKWAKLLERPTTNLRSVLRSCDLYWPTRGQYWGHMICICIDQPEPSFEVMWCSPSVYIYTLWIFLLLNAILIFTFLNFKYSPRQDSNFKFPSLMAKTSFLDVAKLFLTDKMTLFAILTRVHFFLPRNSNSNEINHLEKMSSEFFLVLVQEKCWLLLFM